MAESGLQFVPFSSIISVQFWHRFSELKLNTLLLNEDPLTVCCQTFRYCSSVDSKGKEIFVPGLNITEESLKDGSSSGTLKGTFVNKNTAESFRHIDKTQYINQLGEELWNQLISEECRSEPEKLLNFSVIAYSDLKKYHFYHWMVFPAPLYPARIHLTKCQRINELLPPNKIDLISEELKSLSSPFFLVESFTTNPRVRKFGELPNLMKTEDLVIGVMDFSSIEKSPSWLARPLLALIAFHFPEICLNLKLICWRQFGAVNKSILLTLDLSCERPIGAPRFVGWEKNARGKFGPNVTNLSTTMDPLRLAESAVSLNLKLMKWRLMPNIDLELLENTKCLLLGAGTLGCGVARNLQAWGFRHITFVDSGKVSYSNPVRQSLYTFADCKEGKLKSAAATAALRQIFPGTVADGVTLDIPMPGHPVTPETEEDVKKAVAKLEELFDHHDVVFLLLDSREARWLPTLLGAAKCKVVLNAALGFDSYLVMRHGFKKPAEVDPLNRPQLRGAIPGYRLGCYYCNDVVAPGDSLRDRTLDQQCTVTRPGVSMIASALAVELLVSGLQHPLRFEAPAAISSENEDCEGPLGLVPHSIRGYLSKHSIVMPATEAFGKCTACSDIVVETYKSEGFQFLKKVFEDPNILEVLTGLDKLKDLSGMEEVLEFPESDDEG